MDGRSSTESTCVKLYLCSNPEDSAVERRALREDVFPKLREHCRHTLGLELRVIDPFESADPSRWPDENTRKQLITECRESSAGPFLLALIGHQYGRAGLAAQVEVSEYQLLLQESQRAGISTVELEREYQRDENYIPPSFCLRAANTHTCCPQQDDIKEEEEIDIKAKEDKLMKVFQTTVSLCVHKGLMTADRAQRYYRSALDTDLRFALEDRPGSETNRRCLVYIHKVINAKGRRLIRSKDQPELEDPIPELTTLPADGQLLSELCEVFLPGLVASSQLLVYTTTTECDRRHGYTTARRRGYAESLCRQVCSDLWELINGVRSAGISPQLSNAVSREQAEQEELCSILSRFYEVTRPEEEEIRAYVEQSQPQRLLVVTGGPCTGKTVLLAHCAQQIKSWLPTLDPVVITHFCNLSINLSPKHLLYTLCYQIANKYHSRSSPEKDVGGLDNNPTDHNSNLPTKTLNPKDESTNKVQGHGITQCLDPSHIMKPGICVSELEDQLSFLLCSLPSTQKPLIVILVGLDRIENSFGPKIIKCFQSPLPSNVKLIITMSCNRTQVLQDINPRRGSSQLKSEDKEDSGCVCVQLGPADRKPCVKMLASLLSSSGRRITSGQQALVNQALTSCCLTLYARLLRLHTALWHSDSDVTQSSLPDGVHSSISMTFDHLEHKHGRSIMGRAVSYISLSKTGLTEAELADLLSTDDRVLSAYSQRGANSSSDTGVLQIDVERLLLDLKDFLITRMVGESQVLFWVSRHFKLVAARRYFMNREVRMELHKVLADYFSGRVSFSINKLLENQPSAPNRGTNQKDMFLASQPSCQPLIFNSCAQDEGKVNLRKVLELPLHLLESNNWEELECGLLIFFGFHQAMVQAGLLDDLVSMLEGQEWSSNFCFPRERAFLAGVLRSCACLLQSSPLQLPSVMETSLLPYLEVFPAFECYIRGIIEDRKKKGSGLGVQVCPSPTSVPSVQCAPCDAKTKNLFVTEAAGTKCGVVAEVTDDGTAWVWQGLGSDVVKLSLSSEQGELKFAGVKSSRQFILLSTQCNKLFLWDVAGPQMFLQVKDTLKTEFEVDSSQQTLNKIEGFVACKSKLFMWLRDESFVSVFDVSCGALTHFQCQGSVTCLVYSSDGLYIYCGQEEGTVSVFDTNTFTLRGTCSNSNFSAVNSIILCEEKGEMACVDRTGNIALWEWEAQTRPPRLVKEVLSGDKSSMIINTDYSGENSTLLVCCSTKVTLWETCDWELLDQFLAPQGKAFSQAVLSQDGHLFLALLNDCLLALVWRVSTGECVLSLETNKQPHTLIKTASDVICVTDDGCVTVWDSEMIDVAGTAPKMSCGVKEVVVEETGKWFYTSDGLDTVWRWRFETGAPHAYFLHNGPVEKLRLSPDNIHLLTISAGDIYVWQKESGQNILRISGSRATDILITPNSNFGVSISDRYLSRVWKLLHGSIVCSVHVHLCDAQVSPESTFLIGRRHGDLLAASLWTGSISKRFSCVASSEQVVAFRTLTEHVDFVVVMTASGSLYTWKVAEETVCRHFQLPNMFHCKMPDFQMSTDGSYALLSTENEDINLLDLSQVRLCTVKADGPVIQACLDKTGFYVAYISCPATQETSCVCSLHVRPVLTVARLADGERIGSVQLCKNPSTLVVSKQHSVFVGFEDGSIGVYSIFDFMTKGGEAVRCREKVNGLLKHCPFDRTAFSWLPLAVPNVKWP